MTIDYGVNIYSNAMELLLSDNDLSTQYVHGQNIAKDEVGSVLLTELAGHKSVQFVIPDVTYVGRGILRAAPVPTRDGIKIKWKPSKWLTADMMSPGYLIVCKYT